jgi:hypothetical protein
MRRVKTTVKNGVRVKVTRSETGSVVEADCGCFGHPWRLHTRMNCPALKCGKRPIPCNEGEKR